jgi:hypothetical protein
MCMSLEDYTKDKLWPILVETVHTLVMYPHHKSYTREVILNEKPNIKANELATRLGISLGEALVILYELKEQVSQ